MKAHPPIRGSLLARNALLNLFTLTAPLVVAFVTVPLMIRGFGTDRFGVFSVVWLLLTYLAELGFGTTTTRYAAEALGAGRNQEVAALAWTTAALQAAVGVLIGAVLALCTPLLVQRTFAIPDGLVGEARNALYLVSAALPVLGCARSFRGLLEAAQRFDIALAVQLPITIVTYLLAAFGALAGWPLPWVITTIVAVRILSLPIHIWAAHVALPGISLKPALELSKLRMIGSFAGWVAVSTLVSPLLVYLDRFMIGALLSMAALAFYAAPYEIVGRLMLIPGAIVGALFPAMSQLSAHTERRAEVEQLAARSANLLVVLLAPVVIVILGAARDGLALWLGPEYALRSAAALQILAVGFLINALAHVPYILLHSAARPDLPARFHLIELPVQLVLAWALISWLGITGAALAWTLRLLFDAALLFVAAQRTQLLRWSVVRAHALSTGAALAGVLAVAALAGSWLIPSQLLRLLATAVLAAAAAATLWFGAVDATDRRRLTSLLRPSA